MMYCYANYGLLHDSDVKAFRQLVSCPRDEVYFSVIQNNYLTAIKSSVLGRMVITVDENALKAYPVFRIGVFNDGAGVLESTEPVDITDDFRKYLKNVIDLYRRSDKCVVFDTPEEP